MVRRWKRRLNLEDWTIKCRFAKEGELSEAWAEITPRADHGQADLVIHQDQESHEYWILHELGHVVLAGLSKELGEDLLEERAINRYSRALAKAYGVAIPTKLHE